ncbi:MAG: LytR C-terminal domain-containing protein, partial [Patescibacteria group bacterium]
PLSLINTSSDIGYIQTIFRSNIEGQNIFNLLYAIYNLKIQNIKLLEYKASGLINLKNIDTFIRSNFTGTTFAKSGVSVQILDSSSSNNAVYQFSRYIQNLGGTISSIGIYNQALVKDEIYVGNYSKYKYEVTQIMDILGPSNVTLIKHNPSFYTGDIIVILGSDDNILYSTL